METDTPQCKNLKSWMKQHERVLQHFIWKKVKDQTLMEDILQEVWTKLLEHPAPEHIQRLRSWLLTVALNLIYDRLRQRNRLCSIPLNVDPEFAQSITPTRWVEPSLPSDALERREFWEALEAELIRLPSAQREVFVQHELEAIPFKELSQRMGTSINTLLSRKRYAVLQLRKRFIYFTTK